MKILKGFIGILFLFGGIILSVISGIFTYAMYTSNYVDGSIYFYATGILAIILQSLVFLLSFSIPIIYRYTDYGDKANVILKISFSLSVIGSIAFFSNGYGGATTAPYNKVIEDIHEIITFGTTKLGLVTIQKIIGIWTISIIIEYLVIFLPELGINILTGKKRNIVQDGLKLSTILYFSIFEREKLNDIKQIITKKFRENLNKEVTKINEKPIINAKIDVPHKNIKMPKDYLKKKTNVRTLVLKEVKEAKKNPIIKKNQLNQTNDLYQEVKSYIIENIGCDETIKTSEIKEKFNLSSKKWININNRLKIENITCTVGTSTKKKAL